MVVPVVSIVEGVLNEALVLSEEFGRYVESWNGIPVPVLHPEKNGIAVGANSPDIIERNTIGRVYNSTVDGNKLKNEIWIDVAKAETLGYADLVMALEKGEVIEVSTGYFSDDEEKAGIHNGRAYRTIHRNIRPDHLALLPGEIGACSIEDGCGTPRINKGVKMKLNEAFHTIQKALGLKDQSCNCNKEDPMKDLMKKAQELKANGALSAEQFDMISKMGPEELTTVSALIAALGATEDPEDPAGDMVDQEDNPAAEDPAKKVEDMKKSPTANRGVKAMSQAEFDAAVDKRVADAIERRDLTNSLVANEACPFSKKELDALPVGHLRTMAKKLVVADYSGASGEAVQIVTNSGDNIVPLVPTRGVLTPKQKEA